MGVDPADAFWSDGACVLRGAMPLSEIERARDAVAGLAGTDQLADLSALAGSDETPRFAAGVDHWRVDPAFAVLASQGSLPGLVAEVLRSERVWLYEDSVLVKDAGSTVATRWHTDDGYFHVDGQQLATVWLPLDVAPLAAGALRFVRGSHREGTRYRPTLFVTDDPLPGTDGEVPPQVATDDTSVFGFDLEVGDLTMHHARTLHSSSGNATATARRALSVRYCGDDAVVRVKPGAPPKPGFDAIKPGTPLAVAAPALGLPMVWGHGR